MIVYAAPEQAPDFFDFKDATGRLDYQAALAAEDAYIERIQEWARKQEKSPLAGIVIRRPYADGYAQYVVVKINGKTSLVHLAIGDAWADASFERTATVAELTRLSEASKRFAEAWGTKV